MSNNMEKVNRATEIHRSMTPHQMALRIVELEDIAEIVGQLASERASRITELQADLELAEEAVRAKHLPDVGNMAHDGWQLVPVEPTAEMMDAGEDTYIPTYTGTPVSCPSDVYRAMLSAAPKLGGE